MLWTLHNYLDQTVCSQSCQRKAPESVEVHIHEQERLLPEKWPVIVNDKAALMAVLAYGSGSCMTGQHPEFSEAHLCTKGELTDISIAKGTQCLAALVNSS